MSDDAYIICLSSAGAPPSSIAAGSMPGKCSACGDGVWIAPSSLRFIGQTPGAKVLCVACGVPHARLTKGVFSTLPGVADEFREAAGGTPEEVGQLLDYIDGMMNQ